jgi:DNA (cytosine-5)-methyltransferase 1
MHTIVYDEDSETRDLKIIDLFCGCGGISTGFKNEGFQVLLGADINPHALKTFQRNFPKAKAVETDLSGINPQELLRTMGLKSGELDALVGGPPCQGFSKNVPARNRYHSDPRNKLLLTYIDFVRVFKPKFVVIENVAEMMNGFKGAYTEEIVGSLEKAGYEVEFERLLAADYGVPQLRRRAFFFANRVGVPVTVPAVRRLAPKGEPDLFTKELPYGYVNVWDAIGDLPSLEAGEGNNPCEYAKKPASDYQRLMRAKSEKLHDHVARKLTDPQLERVKHLRPGMGEGVDALPKHLRPKSGYSGAYARLIPDEPARTITRWVFHPGSGRFYHPYDDRVITIREAARLQSFPDWFVFDGTYIQKSHQVGEAVPPLLAQAFAAEIAKALSA